MVKKKQQKRKSPALKKPSKGLIIASVEDMRYLKKQLKERPFHPVPKPEPRRKQSTSYAARERVLHQLVNYLKVERAHYVCEICGGRIHLTGAHIIKRAQGRLDHIGNIIIGCELCHNHEQYGDNGLAVSTEAAQKIVRDRNDDIGLEQIEITETYCILRRNGVKFNVMELDEYD